jgi:hypothetical protein
MHRVSYLYGVKLLTGFRQRIGSKLNKSASPVRMFSIGVRINHYINRVAQNGVDICSLRRGEEVFAPIFWVQRYCFWRQSGFIEMMFAQNSRVLQFAIPVSAGMALFSGGALNPTRARYE